MSKQKNLHAARRAKNDEFYTHLNDIAREMNNYGGCSGMAKAKNHFKDKTVLCNCDDPEPYHKTAKSEERRVAPPSNFVKYFLAKFKFIGLKRLIATHYDPNPRDPSYPGHAYAVIYTRDDSVKCGYRSKKIWLKGNGDFRSDECIEFLKEADIVVTNPPFSLFREFIGQLVEHNKKFLIIGSMNAITYKEVFPLIQSNRVWLGTSNVTTFSQSDGSDKKFGNVTWFTNLTHPKRNEPLFLYREYDPDVYPEYDNYAAIEVSRTKDIPYDYPGVMGVPISFLPTFCPDQFEIIGATLTNASIDPLYALRKPADKHDRPYLEGKRKYTRIFIRNKTPNQRQH